MQTVRPVGPSRSIGSIGSLSQLGAVANANVGNPSSASLITPPRANPVPKFGGTNISAPTQPAPVGTGNVPVHVSLPTQISRPVISVGGRAGQNPVSLPANYPSRAEE